MGERICVDGTPGIGKSAGLNADFVEFIRHLGEEGCPRVVALRVEKILSIWSYSSEGIIDVKVKAIQSVLLCSTL